MVYATDAAKNQIALNLHLENIYALNVKQQGQEKEKAVQGFFQVDRECCHLNKDCI